MTQRHLQIDSSLALAALRWVQSQGFLPTLPLMLRCTGVAGASCVGTDRSPAAVPCRRKGLYKVSSAAVLLGFSLIFALFRVQNISLSSPYLKIQICIHWTPISSLNSELPRMRACFTKSSSLVPSLFRVSFLPGRPS